MARIIPVLDILGGQVVRGIGGRRKEYQPITSRLTSSTDPIVVARALIAATDATTLYVADLDGIMTGTPSRLWHERLAELPVRLLLDHGIRREGDCIGCAGITPVVGTETLEGPHALGNDGGRGKVLSLDLFEGNLLGNGTAWGVATPRDLLAKAIEELGFTEVILLDLARVGGGQGAGTETLLSDTVSRFAHVHVIVGGGVHDARDVQRLHDAGASGVLVASALHEGRIRQEMKST